MTNEKMMQYVDAKIIYHIGKGKSKGFDISQIEFEDIYQFSQESFLRTVSKESNANKCYENVLSKIGTEDAQGEEYFKNMSYLDQTIQSIVIKGFYSVLGLKFQTYIKTGVIKADGKPEFKKKLFVEKEIELGRKLTKEEEKEIDSTFLRDQNTYKYDQIDANTKYNHVGYGTKIDLEGFYSDFNKTITLLLASESPDVRNEVYNYCNGVPYNKYIIKKFFKSLTDFIINLDNEFSSIQDDSVSTIWEGACLQAKKDKKVELFESRLFKEFQEIVMG